MRWPPWTGWRGRSAIRWVDRRLGSAAALALLLSAAPAAARSGGADGRFEQRESSNFVLYQDVDIDEKGGLRGSRRFEQQVLAELEGAHERLDEWLGLSPPRRIQVVVYDPGVFDASFGRSFAFQAAGFFNGAIHIRGATALSAQLARVLHHELVHAAFDAAAPSLVLPAWLNEGAAEWFEARAAGKRHLSGGEAAYLGNALRGGGWLPLEALSGPSFARLGQGTATLAYLQSYGMVEHLVRRYGERQLRSFTTSVVESRDVERALVRTYRMGSHDVAAEFAAELW
jgi:hypothetical protein